MKDKHSNIVAVSPFLTVVSGFFCLLAIACVLPVHLNAAEESYEKDIVRAAKNGDPQSQFALALLYEYGADTIQRNPEKSILWLEKAGKGDVAAACLYLGLKYEYGNRVKRDLKKAACWYKCAAHKDWPAAQNFLGTLYEYGKGVKQSNFMALAWFGLAADHGYPGAAESYKRLCKHECINDLTKLKKKQKELLDKVGNPCN